MKSLKLFQENEKQYDDLLKTLVLHAKEKLGKNIFTDFHLPLNFSLNNLDDSIFKSRSNQTLPLPFPNEMFDLFIKMPKKAINNVYNFNNKGNNITGIYLIGKHNSKSVLYALSVVRFLGYNDYLNFCIKLDVCIAGKTWLNLLRLDSFGPAHPNYFEGKKVFTDESSVPYIQTPHLHVNSQENQILAYNRLSYSPAIELKFNFENFRSDDKRLLKNCFQYFKEFANIDIEINKNIEKDFHYNFNNPLYDYEKIQQVNSVKEL